MYYFYNKSGTFMFKVKSYLAKLFIQLVLTSIKFAYEVVNTNSKQKSNYDVRSDIPTPDDADCTNVPPSSN